VSHGACETGELGVIWWLLHLGNLLVILRANIDGNDVNVVLVVVEKYPESWNVWKRLATKIVCEAHAQFGSFDDWKKLRGFAERPFNVKAHFIESFETASDGLDFALVLRAPSELLSLPILDQKAVLLCQLLPALNICRCWCSPRNKNRLRVNCLSVCRSSPAKRVM